MKKFPPLILFLLFPTLWRGVGSEAIAQDFTQTIRGTIVDLDSKTPLIGVNVILLNSEPLKGTTTDLHGKFKLEKVPVGRQAIKVSYLGYEDAMLNNLILTSGKELVMTVELKEKIYSAGEVEIIYQKEKSKANNELITLSAKSFQSEETGRYAGSRQDPSRMVANYAGVVSGNDTRNDIIVRGNSPLGVLWRLEGVDIPNPNHFSAQGATGGPISMLNNNVLANSDFLTSAFPAEYGNKFAAVFDIKMRKGNNEQHEYTGEFGLNGIELGAEGPFSKKNKSSYLVNYRYSTLELFNALGINFGVTSTPRYQDLSFKLDFPKKKIGNISFFGLGGISSMTILDKNRKADDWSFTQKGENLFFGSKMFFVGISHTFLFNNTTYGKFTVSASANNSLTTVDTVTSPETDFNTYKNNANEGQYIANYVLNKKFSAKHLVRTGITYQYLWFDNEEKAFYRSLNDYAFLNDAQDNTGLLQSFLHWQFRANDKLTFNSGIYFQEFLLNNTWAVEPRVGISYLAFKNQTFAIGYGLYSQTQPLFYYFIKNDSTGLETNRNLDFSRAHHFVFSYDNTVFKDFHLKMEVYYQQLFNIPIEQNKKSSFSMLNIGVDYSVPHIDSLTNKGTGRNYGVELTLEKFFSKRYYFLLTGTLYESKYSGSDAIERDGAFSGKYVVNALAGVEIPLGRKNKNTGGVYSKPEKKVFTLNFKFTQAGGKRFTPVDIAATRAGGNVMYYDALAFSERYNDYSRVDVKMSFKMNQKKITQSVFITVENIFDTRNVFTEVYDSGKKQMRTEYQLGLFPYGGYRIEF